MDTRELKKLIKQGESASLEFKATTSQLKGAFETICGFLNGNGGIVLIGSKNNGDIVGQHVSDSTRQEIAREVKKIEPAAQGQIDIQFISTEKEKFIILLEVQKGNHAPYTYDGRSYERIQSSTMRMPQHRYDQLVAHRFQANFSWEMLIAENYTIDSLDRNLILGVVRKAVEMERMPEDALRQDMPKLLESLKLLEEGRLRNAGVVLFGKDFLPYYPQCQLKLARFKGVDRKEFLDSNIFYGNIFSLLENGMSFIRRHLPVAARIEEGQLERVEIPIIPFSAIREGLINALIHRDYSSRGGSIGLAIYDDRMTISNDGGLLPGVTLEKIKSGFSKLTNPIIAEVLYRCNLIEKWGRGVPDMINMCKAADDPEPEFFSDSVEFKIIFAFPESIGPMVIISDISEEKQFTKRQSDIIHILSEAGKELKPKDILERLQERVSERSLRRDLIQLEKANIVGKLGRGPSLVWYLIAKGK